MQDGKPPGISSTEMKPNLRAQIKRARAAVSPSFRGLPDKATTPGQKELEKKHGSPRNFAERCVAAIGEISVDEANRAVEAYYETWQKA